ncbi:hypothetical protein Vafri_5315 [Volvox africanus]|uniref:Uncharacterized protein n=1 Tax=Volvox africanus TaxID=51714 RepID=A0A8J4AX61_9CHLO|nr:hypothetical protein Vafri_5315 [Volvox africanus]
MLPSARGQQAPCLGQEVNNCHVASQSYHPTLCGLPIIEGDVHLWPAPLSSYRCCRHHHHQMALSSANAPMPAAPVSPPAARGRSSCISAVVTLRPAHSGRRHKKNMGTADARDSTKPAPRAPNNTSKQTSSVRCNWEHSSPATWFSARLITSGANRPSTEGHRMQNHKGGAAAKAAGRATARAAATMPTAEVAPPPPPPPPSPLLSAALVTKSLRSLAAAESSALRAADCLPSDSDAMVGNISATSVKTRVASCLAM